MATAAGLMLVAPARSADAQTTETIAFDGRDVAVWNLVGSLRVVGGEGGTASARVTRRGADGGRLTLERGERDGYRTLVVRSPENVLRRPPEQGRGRTMTRIGTDGTWGWGRSDWRGSRSIEISDRRGALDASADVELRLPRGARARVFLLVGRVTLENVDGELHVDVSSADVTTNRTRGSLFLDTGSGEVSVNDAEGRLTLDSGSGRVQVRNARGDVLNADTGSGDVIAADVTFDEGRFDTGSGAVRIESASLAKFWGDTGSGDVTVDFRNPPRELFIDAGSGDITLVMRDGVGAELAISTGSGDISTDFPITITRKSRRSLVGTIGNGGGRWTIDTGSGDVRLRRP